MSIATITIDRKYKPWLATPGKDTSRPALNAIQLHPNGYMVAADGYMLMMAPIIIDGEMDKPVLVPATFLEAVHKYWKTLWSYPLTVTSYDDGTATTITGVTAVGEVTVPEAEGQYPDYWRIIPTEYEDATTASVDPVKLTRLYESLVGDRKEPIGVAVYQGTGSNGQSPCFIAPTMSAGFGVIMPLSLSDKDTTSRRNLDDRIKLFRDGEAATDDVEPEPQPETHDSADEYVDATDDRIPVSDYTTAKAQAGDDDAEECDSTLNCPIHGDGDCHEGESVHDEVKRLCLEALDDTKTVSTLTRQINGRMAVPYPSDAQGSLGTLVHDVCNELTKEGKIAWVIDGGKGNNAKYAPLNDPATLVIKTYGEPREGKTRGWDTGPVDLGEHGNEIEVSTDGYQTEGYKEPKREPDLVIPGYPASYADEQDEVLSLHIEDVR